MPSDPLGGSRFKRSKLAWRRRTYHHVRCFHEFIRYFTKLSKSLQVKTKFDVNTSASKIIRVLQTAYIRREVIWMSGQTYPRVVHILVLVLCQSGTSFSLDAAGANASISVRIGNGRSLILVSCACVCA